MKTRFLTFLCAFLFSSTSFAQSTYINYFVNNTSSTICDHRIQAFFKDSQNHMWIGTADGASRYDGSNWTTFTTGNGLPSNDVKSISEDASGNIWFGTTKGIGVYNGSSWSYYTWENDGISASIINHIVRGSDDFMYIGSATSHPSLNKGVVKFEGGSFEEVESIHGYMVTDMSVNPVNRDLWVGTSVGASYFNGMSWDTVNLDDGLDNNYIKSIDHDPSGDTWIATNGSIYIFNGDTAIRETSNYNLKDMLVLTPFTAWLGTFLNGALYYDGNGVTEYSDNSPIDSDQVNVLYSDTAIWFGTAGNSVSTLNGSNWTRFMSDGLPHHNIKDILEDKENKIIMATRGFGVGIFDRSSWSFIRLEHGLASNDVVSLMEDNQGSIWIGYGMWSSSVISKLDGSNWTHFGTAHGLSTGDITRIIQASNGDVWMIKYFGSMNEDVYRFDGNSWTSWDTPEAPLDILEDKDGNIWVAMEDGAGVQKFDGSTWTQYSEPLYFGTGFNPDYCDITRIVEDENGDLIFLRSVSDGVRYDGTDFSLVDWYSGGSYSGLVDSFGNLWIGTEYGIEEFTGPDWKPGLGLGYSTGKVNDIIQTHDGHIWFATENGLTDFTPDDFFPVIEKVNTSDHYCNENNGSIEIIASIGTGADLYYSIDDGETWSANPVFSGLTGGTYKIKVTDYMNVDSATVSLTDVPVQSIILGGDQVICQGDSIYLSVLNTFESYQWIDDPAKDSYELWAKTTGDYFVEVSDANGCTIQSDTLKLTVGNPWFIQETHEICQGGSYFWEGASYQEAGVYTREFISSEGCDSIRELTLIVNPKYQFNETIYLCEGETLQWQGQEYTAPGFYTAEYTTVKGCDSIYSVDIRIAEFYYYEIIQSIYEGNSFHWQGNDYTEGGVYTAEYTTQYGCDSIYTLYLTVDPVKGYYFRTDSVVCDVDHILWRDQYIDQSGVYYDQYTSASGGDSIYELTLTMGQKYYFTEEHSIYQGQSYNWHGLLCKESGMYYDSLQSVTGCDSIYALNLIIEAATDYFFHSDTTICGDKVINWQNQIISQSGIYRAEYTAYTGADSIYEITVSMSEPYFGSITHSICDGESFTWEGNQYSETGTYLADYTTVTGCDSILSLDLSVLSVPESPSITMENGQLISGTSIGNQWFLNGEAIDGANGNTLVPEANGDYHVVVTGENGCPSAPSETYSVTGVGVDLTIAAGIEIWPNPFEKGVNVRITTEGQESLHYYLYDLTGKLLVQKLTREKEFFLELEYLPSGFYMLRVVDNQGNKMEIKKLMKK